MTERDSDNLEQEFENAPGRAELQSTETHGASSTLTETRPRRAASVVSFAMVGIIGLLGICHVINYYIKSNEVSIFGGGYFHRFFDLNQEQNIPAWYASVLWFAVFQLAALNYVLECRAKSTEPHKWVWLLFALLFLVASADEVATIHEHVGSFLQDLVVPTIRSQIATFFIRNGFGPESFVVHFSTSRSPWILFYAPFLLAAGGFCWLFLWRRFAYDRHLRHLMVAAALCYIVAESFDYVQGMRSPPINLIPQPLGLSWPVFLDLTVMIEELLEDLGTVCIIVALAKHLSGRFQDYLRKNKDNV